MPLTSADFDESGLKLTFTSVELDSLSAKCSTQGLVMLWNMEFWNQAVHVCTNSETYGSLGAVMYCYRQDPIVNRIVSHSIFSHSHAHTLHILYNFIPYVVYWRTESP